MNPVVLIEVRWIIARAVASFIETFSAAFGSGRARAAIPVAFHPRWVMRLVALRPYGDGIRPDFARAART